jgi:sensor histidine kinase YesM
LVKLKLMEILTAALISLLVAVVLIFIIRLFGAWMLRINEMIKLLWVIKEMLETKLNAEELESVKSKLKKRGY